MKGNYDEGFGRAQHKTQWNNKDSWEYIVMESINSCNWMNNSCAVIFSRNSHGYTSGISLEVHSMCVCFPRFTMRAVRLFPGKSHSPSPGWLFCGFVVGDRSCEVNILKASISWLLRTFPWLHRTLNLWKPQLKVKGLCNHIYFVNWHDLNFNKWAITSP